MKTIYYIIIADILLFLVVVKFIFGSINIFVKAFLGHVFSDFDDLETFQKWDKEHDIKHKINLLYAAIIGIFGGSFLLYLQFN